MTPETGLLRCRDAFEKIYEACACLTKEQAWTVFCQQRVTRPAPKAIDVEALKRKPQEDVYIPEFQTEQNKGWNDCIDHLNSRGLFGQVDQKSEREILASDIEKLLDYYAQQEESDD